MFGLRGDDEGMQVLQKHPRLRWLVPVTAAFALVTGGLVGGAAIAEPKLPSRTPEQLLVALQQAKVDGFSGTVEQTADLGIPQLTLPGDSGGDGGVMSLLSGTHLMRVWAAGDNKARLALQSRLGESDLISNGEEVWRWSSSENTATQYVLPKGQSHRGIKKELPADAPKTPQEAAERLLDALGSTTTISSDSAVTVAGRPAYELVLRPTDDRSLLTEARIAVDGETSVPLRVEVFGADQDPVFSTGFTAVDFSVPADSVFEFSPPAGADVETVNPADHTDKGEANKGKPGKNRADKSRAGKNRADEPTVVGKGWTTVVVTNTGTNATAQGADELGPVLAQLPEVSGDWGHGRLLSGKAFSAVLTDDGRVAVGAVKPELLYEALGK